MSASSDHHMMASDDHLMDNSAFSDSFVWLTKQKHKVVVILLRGRLWKEFQSSLVKQFQIEDVWFVENNFLKVLCSSDSWNFAKTLIFCISDVFVCAGMQARSTSYVPSAAGPEAVLELNLPMSSLRWLHFFAHNTAMHKHTQVKICAHTFSLEPFLSLYNCLLFKQRKPKVIFFTDFLLHSVSVLYHRNRHKEDAEMLKYL